MVKIMREKFKTYEGVFDQFTLRNLFELSSKGYFDELLSPLALGKEANVFVAAKGDEKVAVKIYRLETCDFNKMYEYIVQDPRYVGMSKNRRKVIFHWTQREFRNLLKAREANILVPTPIHFKDNILIESFLGNAEAAPKLKDIIPRAKRKLFEEVMQQIKRLWHAGLVHGDLSPFNILYWQHHAYFIDFSQAVPTTARIAKEYLIRDVKNVLTYFKRLLVIKETPEEIAEKIIAEKKEE